MRAMDGRYGFKCALAALLGILAAAFLLSGMALAHGRHGHHRHKHHHLHRQSLAGPAKSAPVKIVKAPPVGGKGGGVDPGDDYPPRWKNVPQDSVLDPWLEYNRECTSFVAWALHSRNGFEMPFHQNANQWGPMAIKRGFVVNSQPAVGSVAWSNGGVFGHVAYVVAVNGGNVTVEEYNFLVRGAYDKRVVSASAFTGFIHFKDLQPAPVTPPSVAPTPSVPSSPSVQPESTPPSSGTTHAETTGGVTHTWTNYTNAGGVQGPSIPSNTTVLVSCALTGFRVADGNTWWYRIASSPWSNAYYASADAFYNNGQTSGSLIGTPFVD
ncbi:MAG: CHAP domain-containing protein, partial [Solirubrobacterales bacterium]